MGDVHQSTGKYRYLGFHWHAFSYEFTAAQSGPSALEAYLSLESQPVLVIPEDWRNSCGVRCSGHGLPDLTELRDDLYVFPESLEWSMAFTRFFPAADPTSPTGTRHRGGDEVAEVGGGQPAGGELQVVQRGNGAAQERHLA